MKLSDRVLTNVVEMPLELLELSRILLEFEDVYQVKEITLKMDGHAKSLDSELFRPILLSLEYNMFKHF